ncbi:MULTISPECIES: ankyrin repeat domain-containing protein [Legionella]|uniref:ankyrin repeat domain-containing protein n=1 Tax=Legionella TaxID=445 RepID=UPI00095EE88D|nr:MULTISPECIES: ankyrin repeat domain-containing protein [Legionella]MBN9227797.1 ankyrin repeat domain-containing protein [Legionella steelei]OJW05754.1 MAG: hypothetical protein BGO44_02115 [Legionella sp. 39-23]
MSQSKRDAASAAASQMPDIEPFSLESLPFEVLVHIFDELPPEAVVLYFSLNHNFIELAKAEDYWRGVHAKHLPQEEHERMLSSPDAHWHHQVLANVLDKQLPLPIRELFFYAHLCDLKKIQEIFSRATMDKGWKTIFTLINTKNRHGVNLFHVLHQHGQAAQPIFDFMESQFENYPHLITPTQRAIIFRQHDKLQALVRFHSVNEPFSYGMQCLMPLHCAAILGYEDIVRVLIKAGASIYQQDAPHATRSRSQALSDGYTPVLFALQNGHVGVVQVMMEMVGLDVNSTVVDVSSDSSYYPSSTRYPLLFIAAKYNQPEMMKFLQEKGAQIDDQSCYSLSFAARTGHKTLVKMLLDHGVDMNKRTSAVHMAAVYGHLDIVKLLLREGVTVLGDTPHISNKMCSVLFTLKSYIEMNLRSTLLSKHSLFDGGNSTKANSEELRNVRKLLDQCLLDSTELNEDTFRELCNTAKISSTVLITALSKDVDGLKPVPDAPEFNY